MHFLLQICQDASLIQHTLVGFISKINFSVCSGMNLSNIISEGLSFCTSLSCWVYKQNQWIGFPCLHIYQSFIRMTSSSIIDWIAFLKFKQRFCRIPWVLYSTNLIFGIHGCTLQLSVCQLLPRWNAVMLPF